MSTLATPKTSHNTLNANFKAPPVTDVIRSIAANNPLNVLVSLSIVSSDMTNVSVNALNAATELYNSSDDCGTNISFHALPKARSGSTIALRILCNASSINCLPLGLCRLEISSSRGVPAFSAS